MIGGGHAGAEAAWAAANLLGEPGSVALVTIDPAKTGVMSCNPAIGGLAKGQLVREIDALGGLMGLATDATGIQFKVLNTSRGPAVHGPRAQCDKHAYAETVQSLIASRTEIVVVRGTVEELLVERGHIRGVRIAPNPDSASTNGTSLLLAPSVVLTTGTFMRGLMHTGESRTPGGRYGEAAATGISGALSGLGFELGRLKTGTPPRLKKASINWNALPEARGDDEPVPFSDLTLREPGVSSPLFPCLPQIECRQTQTSAAIHDLIRGNLHRAPMYSGQIESVGPRYCPSIEDKVIRFADREAHTVFLEPESLRPPFDDWVYCNGISTSLPADVQDQIVRAMPGCERAEIYRYGYAVEYDMVRPHQIHATGMTKLVEGLFLAGQINGTSGYEEAAAQGLVAGINAARRSRGQHDAFILARDQAYIGVLMDDLVTKTPVEPYRMFTSRAEHRLLLRADNAPDRLTPIAIELGLLSASQLGAARTRAYAARSAQLEHLRRIVATTRIDGEPLARRIRRPEFEMADFRMILNDTAPAGVTFTPAALATAFADAKYAPYLQRQAADISRAADLEHKRLPRGIDYGRLVALRPEARQALARFRPDTFGQAGRLEGLTPADLTLLSVLVRRPEAAADAEAGSTP